MDKSNGGDDGI